MNSGRGALRERLETLVQPVVAGLVALVTLIGLIGPAIKSPSPHDIAVGLVGPAPATQQIAGAFATNAPGSTPAAPTPGSPGMSAGRARSPRKRAPSTLRASSRARSPRCFRPRVRR